MNAAAGAADGGIKPGTPEFSALLEQALAPVLACEDLSREQTEALQVLSAIPEFKTAERDGEKNKGMLPWPIPALGMGFDQLVPWDKFAASWSRHGRAEDLLQALKRKGYRPVDRAKAATQWRRVYGILAPEKSW